MSEKPFKGQIELDIRDSVPDWSPYLADEAPEGASAASRNPMCPVVLAGVLRLRAATR